jgi:hypothetical protein
MADFDKEAIAAEIKSKADDTGNEEELLASVTKNMEALGFDPKADEVVPEDEPVPDEDLEDVDDEEDDDLESEDEEDDESTPEDEDEEEVKDDDEVAKDEEAQDDPQLSDAYYRAAIHSGMDKEQITKFMETDSELALKTFGNLYESMNRTSQEFADLGRYKKQLAEKGTDAPEEKPGFAKIDTTDMRSEYGDVVADQFDKQQEQLAELFDKQSAVAPVVNSNDQQLQEQETKHATEQIEAFFNSADMAKYDETYGTVEKDDVEWTGLLPGAKMNRVMVIDSAIELMDGAAAAGRTISVPDAMERAHLLVTQPIRDKIIRDDIMKNVVKRSKGITLKPSSKVADAVEKSKGPKTDTEVEDNAATRLAKVFG